MSRRKRNKSIRCKECGKTCGSDQAVYEETCVECYREHLKELRNKCLDVYNKERSLEMNNQTLRIHLQSDEIKEFNWWDVLENNWDVSNIEDLNRLLCEDKYINFDGNFLCRTEDVTRVELI